MRIALIFLAVFFATVAKEIRERNSNDDDDAFERYKKIYRVNYKDNHEEKNRKAQYMKCRNLIKKHNKDYEKGLVRLAYQNLPSVLCIEFFFQLLGERKLLLR
jgi:hypothetical protein